MWVLLKHKSGELLKRGEPPESASTDFGDILLRENGCTVFMEVQSFSCSVLFRSRRKD